MDKQLKQRLLGAAVVLALAVIIVPELVKRPADSAPLATTTVPPEPKVVAAEPGIALQLPDPNRPMDGNGADTNVGALAESDQGVPSDQELARLNPDSDTGTTDITISIDDNDQSSADPSTTSGGGATDNDLAATGSTPIDKTAEPEATDGAGDSAPLESDTADSETASTVDAAAADAATSAAAENAATTDATPTDGTTAESATDSLIRPAENVAKIELPDIELVSLKYRASGNVAAAGASSNKVTGEGSAEPTPAGGAGQWMVQAGAFTVARNANLLRDRLRAKSFPATTTAPAKVEGRTLYRVQVGPFGSKGESERIRDRLQREASVEGAVLRFN